MSAPGRETTPWLGLATATGLWAAAELKPGDLVAERFRIVRLLGMGAMGVVFQAHDQKLDVDVALKLLRPELASKPDAFERFRQELLLARQVSSPHVVRIHDLVQHGQIWLISMDFVPGESLERRLSSQGSLAPAEALSITRQLALGLAAAHQRGVVHRDLKPANVLIDPDGNALITDFGVARSVGATGLTASGMVVGTPAYLSPEQAQALPVDGRSDLYALGLMLYEMLSGTLPFADGTPSEMLIQRILNGPAPIDTLCPHLPAWVVRLVALLLDPRLARRFQSAEQVVRAIDTETVVVPAAAGRRRRLALSASALLALAAIAIWAGWQWQLPGRTEVSAPAAATMLDLAVLPVRVEPAAGDTAAVADGVVRYLVNDLIDGGELTVAEPRRLSDAMARLGFDSAAAARNRPQLATALNARQMLEGEWIENGQGASLTLSLFAADATEPRWQERIQAADPEALLAQLPALMAAVRSRLGLPAHAVPAIHPEQLRLLAAAGSQPLAQDLDAIPVDLLAMLGWDRLQWLEVQGENDLAQIEAGRLGKQLAGQSGRAARRTQALAAVVLGESDRVVDELALLSRNLADHRIRRLWARALAELGQLSEAQAALEHIVAEDRNDFDAWYAMGKYAYMQGDTLRAVERWLNPALGLAEMRGDTRAQAEALNLLGLGYKSLGNLPIALDKLQSAVRLWHALGYARGEARSLQNAATVLATLGRFDQARTALAEARTLLAPIADVAAQADLENDIGVFEEEQGNFRPALDAYRSALSLRQSLRDQRMIGESLQNVGFAYYQIGEFDNAEVHWRQAASLYQQLEDRSGQVRVQQLLGLAETARGDFVAARESLSSSLRMAEAAQMAEERAVSLAGLGELDRLQGEFASALARSADALARFEQRDDLRGSLELQLQRAAILIDLGAWSAARSVLDGLSSEQFENREQRAWLHLRLAEIAEGEQNYPLAIEQAGQAVAVARAAHSSSVELPAQLLNARLLVASGQGNRARAELAKVQDGLSRHASVPLRLLVLETALVVEPGSAARSYQQAQSQLARLPDWGRSLRLHLLAANALAASDPAAASAARARAAAVLARQVHRLAAAESNSLRNLAQALGLPESVP
ncbi:MAG: protein kinase [Lysobacterales bacterium]